jgi:hypothetical protein
MTAQPEPLLTARFNPSVLAGFSPKVMVGFNPIVMAGSSLCVMAGFSPATHDLFANPPLFPRPALPHADRRQTPRRPHHPPNRQRSPTR